MAENIGIDFSSSGSVLTLPQLEDLRRKRGECLNCGQMCYRKKLFKTTPLTIHGSVLNGRCLKCKPLDVTSKDAVLPAVSRPATERDMARFERSRSSLRLQGPGVGGGPLGLGGPISGGGRGGGAPIVNGNMRRTQSATPTSHPTMNGSTNNSNGSNSMERAQSHASLGGASLGTAGTAPARMAGHSSRSPVPSRIPQSVHEETRSTRSADDDFDAPRGGSSKRRNRTGGVNRSLSMHDGSPRSADFRPETESVRSISSKHSSRSTPGMSPETTQSAGPPPILEHMAHGMPLDRGPFPDIVEGDEGRKPAAPAAASDLHSAMVGSMAARQIAANYRSRKQRKQAEEAAAAAAPESAPDFNDYSQTLSPEAEPHQRLGTTGSNQSTGTESWKTDEWKTDEDDINLYAEPFHGVLNRGGQFKFDEPGLMPLNSEGPGADPNAAHAPPFSTMNAESNRTMSSMSSVEEESGTGNTGNGHRQLSWKPAAEFSMKKRAADLFEDDDDLSIDSDTGSARSKEKDMFDTRSNLSSRSGRPGSSGGRHAMSEQRAIENLSAASKNYIEILSIMRELPRSSLVQQEGLKHISNLHLTDSEYTELMEIGALDTVVHAMKMHADSAEVQNCACRAIWNLSATPQNQISLVQAGALDRILDAMERFAVEAELQEKALAALSNLGAAAENQVAILQNGTIQKIVEAMNNHSEDGPVQSKACSALTNFASYDSPLKRQIMALGGGGAVVISMIMHPEDIDLQEKALRALRNICANSDENKVEVANVGGIDAVISAMQVHRDEPGVQEAGAWTLSNLAVNPENKAVIGDSGGIDVVIRAMWVHSDNGGVQEWCCRALWTLSVDAQNRQVMMEVGGISAVVNAMQAHADAATVQEKGCGVLSNLAATDDSSKVRIVEEEALDAIIMAMVLHSENRSVQDRACSVLKRLAIGPNLKPMQAANVGELVRQASRRFPDKCGEKARSILAIL